MRYSLLEWTLDAHLRDQLFLARHRRQPPRFVDIVRERLLHVDVQAELHRAHGHGRVHVVGRADAGDVEILVLLVEHARASPGRSSLSDTSSAPAPGARNPPPPRRPA